MKIFDWDPWTKTDRSSCTNSSDRPGTRNWWGSWHHLAASIFSKKSFLVAVADIKMTSFWNMIIHVQDQNFKFFSNFRISSPSSFVTINPIDFVWATQVEFRRLLNGTNGDFQFLDFWNFGEYLNKEMSQNFDEFFEIENEVPEPWFPRYFHLWILYIWEINFFLRRFGLYGWAEKAFQIDAGSAAPSTNQKATL